MTYLLCKEIGKYCFLYIDDIVVYSKYVHTHFQHLQKVFNILEAAGLTLNLKKCNLCQRSLTFLRHTVSAEGVKTDHTKIEVVQNYPAPRNIKELQWFLGLANW